MKRRGSLLIEVVISILIFLIGLVALAGSLTLSLKMIVQSGDATKQEQDVVNKYNEYTIKQVMKHNATLTDYGAIQVSGVTFNITIGDKQISNLKVYTFATKDKKGSDIYVVTR